MKEMKLKSLAKINLGLDVLGRRENGYHDVRMIMQTVYLYDDVIMTQKDEGGVELTSNLFYLPADRKNIAYKAAEMLLEEFSLSKGVKIHLKKRIPVAAGLAGGSGNAAAVLYGMNRLFDLRLSEQDLMERGVKLGADVPYCIMRGTVLAEGIGEQLQRISPMPDCTVVLAKPPISVSTKIVYEKLDSIEHPPHPDIDAQLRALEKGSLQEVADTMENILELVTEDDYPVIKKIKQMMIDGGAAGAMMSGSGPTVFGLFADKKQAKATASAIRSSGVAKQVYVANVHRNKYER